MTTRERWSLAAAFALHVAIMALALAPAGPRAVLPPAPPPAPEPVSAIELELLAEAAAEAIAVAAVIPSGDALGRPSTPRPAIGRAGDVAAVSSAPAAPAPDEAAPAPAPPIALVTPDFDRLGIGDLGAARAPNRFVGPLTESERGGWSASPNPPSPAEAQRRLDQAFADAKTARDVSLGLDPSGPVVSALESATHASTATERGYASFLVRIDAEGLVLDLRVVSSRGGESGWAEVRDRARAALAGKKLTLRGAKGAEITVLVDSDVRMPSGQSVGRPVTPKLEDSRIVQHENVPAGGTAVVVKAYTVGGFDLVDIGALPTRVVHARLVSIRNL